MGQLGQAMVWAEVVGVAEVEAVEVLRVCRGRRGMLAGLWM